jgi:hypothetical protein
MLYESREYLRVAQVLIYVQKNRLWKKKKKGINIVFRHLDRFRFRLCSLGQDERLARNSLMDGGWTIREVTFLFAQLQSVECCHPHKKPSDRGFASIRLEI